MYVHNLLGTRGHNPLMSIWKQHDASDEARRTGNDLRSRTSLITLELTGELLNLSICACTYCNNSGYCDTVNNLPELLPDGLE